MGKHVNGYDPETAASTATKIEKPLSRTLCLATNRGVHDRVVRRTVFYKRYL